MSGPAEQKGIDNLLYLGTLAVAASVVGLVAALIADDRESVEGGLVTALVGSLVGGVFLGGDYLYRRQQAAIGHPLKGGRGIAAVAWLLSAFASAMLSAFHAVLPVAVGVAIRKWSVWQLIVAGAAVAALTIAVIVVRFWPGRPERTSPE